MCTHCKVLSYVCHSYDTFHIFYLTTFCVLTSRFIYKCYICHSEKIIYVIDCHTDLCEKKGFYFPLVYF